jgi:hypothetical protein
VLSDFFKRQLFFPDQLVYPLSGDIQDLGGLCGAVEDHGHEGSLRSSPRYSEIARGSVDSQKQVSSPHVDTTSGSTNDIEQAMDLAQNVTASATKPANNDR